MSGNKWTGELAFTIAALLSYMTPCVAANLDMPSAFGQTCVASASSGDLKALLKKEGWNAFATLAQSHLEREIATVTPMLEAQGLASDYTIYHRDAGGRHLELAYSETKKPIPEKRKLIGCGIYDFDAAVPINRATLNAFAPTIVAQKSTIGDVQVTTWNNAFGDGSGMRAVFVPATSSARGQLGFTGMMLGTYFLSSGD